MGPLHGLTVLDFTRVLSGPYCTMVLGDLGARVIKLEHPGRGDDTRRWGPPFLGEESAYFLSVNRNKESVAVDFKQPGGLDVVRRLVAKADVLVENFRPGTLDALGLDAVTVRAAHPRLVYCSISGYGQTGPRREEPGYDAVMQAEGGLMSITGAADGPPYRLGVAIVDIVSGMFAAQGVLAALVARGTTGQGQIVDVGMLDATTALLTYQAGNFFASGAAPGRLGNRHPTIAPYETFATKDGDLALAVGNDSLWQAFCRAAELADLGADPRFATNALRLQNYAGLKPCLDAVFATKTRAEWSAILLAAGVPNGAFGGGGLRRSADAGTRDGRQRAARDARARARDGRAREAVGDARQRAHGTADPRPAHGRGARRVRLRRGDDSDTGGERCREGGVMAMDPALLRKRLRQVIEGAKKDAAARRDRAGETREAYGRLLDDRAIPAFRAVANVLKGEGLSFDVTTPSGGVRLGPERSREDGIELGLDATFDPPRPMLTVVRVRGSRTLRAERALKDGALVEAITEEDVVEALLGELVPWLER
jgi:crotonobetainyl-CoA:carnitine CoA-transferase CaiB-like acyl-CoA transferase